MRFFRRLLARLRGPRRARPPAAPSLPPAVSSTTSAGTTTADEAIRMAQAVRSPDAREAELDRWLEFATTPDVDVTSGSDFEDKPLPVNEQPPGPSEPPSPTHVEAPIEKGTPNLDPAEQSLDEEVTDSHDLVVAEVRVLLVDVATLSESPIDTQRFAPKPRKAPRQAEYASPLPVPVLHDMLERFEAALGPVAHAVTGEPITVDLPQRHNTAHYSLADHFAELTGQDRVTTLDDLLSGSQSSIDVLDRLECARLVARTIHALHTADLVTSGISSSSFGVSLDERPQIWLLEPRLLRPIGGEVLDGSLPVRGADEDRHELAGLIAETLGLRGHERPAGTAPTIPGLHRHQTDQVLALLRRAGLPGRRPSAAHWLEALAA